MTENLRDDAPLPSVKNAMCRVSIVSPKLKPHTPIHQSEECPQFRRVAVSAEVPEELNASFYVCSWCFPRSEFRFSVRRDSAVHEWYRGQRKFAGLYEPARPGWAEPPKSERLA